MNQETVLFSLNGLDNLVKEIESSQRSGQPLPADTTKKWAAVIKEKTAEIRGALGIKIPRSLMRKLEGNCCKDS